MSSFGNFLWIMISTFFFVAYLTVLFQVVVDVFRDQDLNGWAKAGWLVALIFVPVLTALVYVIARGKGMAARRQASVRKAREETDDYVRSVAGTGPADQIAKAKTLLDSGAISADEFRVIKGKALGDSRSSSTLQ